MTGPREHPRIGLFGILGSGNLGNDASVDALVAHLAEHYPDARLSFFCMGPDRIAQRYGAPAVSLQWYEAHAGNATGAPAVLLKIVGRLLDPLRTLAWARRQDVVLVPGMGVLEATVPLRPWGFPYSLFALSVAGRLTGTRVALVCVGADMVTKRLTRRLITGAARLAHYRSYRDDMSRDAMHRMGVDVTSDQVYPDLAFALAPPAVQPGTTGAVGVGVMAYYGDNDERDRSDDLHRAYVDTMKGFVRRLVDAGREVRLFTGDRMDQPIVEEILADLAERQPRLEPSRVVAERATTMSELAQKMAAVDTVVATRYHNVLCALKIGKPTLSVGYAAKNDVLMAAMGLGEFCQSARSVDLGLLLDQFHTAESRRAELIAVLAERNRRMSERLEQQFSALPDVVGTPATRPQEVR